MGEVVIGFRRPVCPPVSLQWAGSCRTEVSALPAAALADPGET
jgi:hypothetical protein